MTPEKAVYTTLLKSGLPGTKTEWHLGNVPPLPWFVYYRRKGSEVRADNENYAEMPRFRAELWMQSNDREVRDAFEEQLRLFGPFTTNESWVASENAYQVEYTFTYHPGSITE